MNCEKEGDVGPVDVGSTRPTLNDIARAAARIAPYLLPTPIVRATREGSWLKLESLQVTGAYKVRGALNALIAHIERGDRRPVVAASAGNHALGVAWSAQRLGLQANVVVPNTAPLAKMNGAAALQANLISKGETFEHAYVHALELAAKNDWRFVHAFDDRDVIAGQGTVALELLHFAPDAVLIPIGGGGLAAGMGLVLKAHNISAWGVQVENVDGMGRKLEGKKHIDPSPTLADGLRVSNPGRLTSSICSSVLEGVVRITENQLRTTVLELAQGDRIVAEGAGAVSVAALGMVPGKRKIALVSGGNIDLTTLAELVNPKTVPPLTQAVGME